MRDIRFVAIVAMLPVTLVTFVVGITIWAPLGHYWSAAAVFLLLALLAGAACSGSARH